GGGISAVPTGSGCAAGGGAVEQVPGGAVRQRVRWDAAAREPGGGGRGDRDRLGPRAGGEHADGPPVDVPGGARLRGGRAAGAGGEAVRAALHAWGRRIGPGGAGGAGGRGRHGPGADGGLPAMRRGN